GFLITCLLLEEWDRSGTVSLKQFYLRRAFRLLPALFVLVFVWTLAFILWPDPSQPRKLIPREALLTLCYLRNYVDALGIDCSRVFKHAWSLAVEEHFYFTWPLLLLMLLRLRCSSRTLAGVLVLAIGAFALLRYCLCHPTLAENFPQLYCRSEARADALLC